MQVAEMRISPNVVDMRSLSDAWIEYAEGGPDCPAPTSTAVEVPSIDGHLLREHPLPDGFWAGFLSCLIIVAVVAAAGLSSSSRSGDKS